MFVYKRLPENAIANHNFVGWLPDELSQRVTFTVEQTVSLNTPVVYVTVVCGQPAVRKLSAHVYVTTPSNHS